MVVFSIDFVSVYCNPVIGPKLQIFQKLWPTFPVVLRMGDTGMYPSSDKEGNSLLSRNVSELPAMALMMIAGASFTMLFKLLSTYLHPSR